MCFTCSVAQVLKVQQQLLLLQQLMPVPPPLVSIGRSLLLPVTAARTHASCSVSCKLHSLNVVCGGPSAEPLPLRSLGAAAARSYYGSLLLCS